MTKPRPPPARPAPDPDPAVARPAGAVVYALSESDRLEILSRHTSDALIVTDVDGRTLWCNEAFERMSGHPAASLLGRKPGDVLQGPAPTARPYGACARRSRPASRSPPRS